MVTKSPKSKKARPQSSTGAGQKRHQKARNEPEDEEREPPSTAAASGTTRFCRRARSLLLKASLAACLVLVGTMIRVPALKVPNVVAMLEPVTTTATTTTRLTTSTTTTKRDSQIKLIINSHAWYTLPLTLLLRSLREAGFTHWDETVIIFGGSRQHVPPHDPPAWWSHLAPAGVTFVNTTLNNYDFNAASGLYRYRSHPRVRSKSYLYILDSSTVGRGFPAMFDKMTDVKPYEMHACPKPCSNTYAFGHGVVERYKENFDVNLTKLDGNHLEHARGNTNVRGVYVMDHFADHVHWLRKRERQGAVDIYSTGYPRVTFYIPDFDVYKYILEMRTGDIGEGGKPTRPEGYR